MAGRAARPISRNSAISPCCRRSSSRRSGASSAWSRRSRARPPPRRRRATRPRRCRLRPQHARRRRPPRPKRPISTRTATNSSTRAIPSRNRPRPPPGAPDAGIGHLAGV
ncbi:hypothetical protein F3J10_04125, partial [Burkholderia sp. Cy-637]|nr:hypothetical protein [Burkholderia sp. Cy-637]